MGFDYVALTAADDFWAWASSPTMSDNWRWFFGFASVLMCTTSILFLVVIILAMVKFRLYAEKSAYRIMIAQHMCDIGQLFLHMMAGLALLVNRDFNNVANMYLGTSMYFTWNVMIFLCLLLAIDRFHILIFKHNERRHKATDLSIGVFVLLGAVTCYLFWVCDHYLVFRIHDLAWSTKSTADSFLYDILYWSQYGELVLAFILSVIVVAWVVCHRLKYGLSQRVRSLEMRILAQNTFSFFSTISNMYVWNWQNSFGDARLAGAFINLHWVSICAMAPYISVGMNGEVRSCVRRYVRGRGQEPVRPTVSIFVTRVDKVSSRGYATASSRITGTSSL